MRVLNALCVAACANAGWIDTDTPNDARTITGYGDGAAHALVMSDEFDVPDRSFRDGQDPRWTAVHKNDYTNKALQFYHEAHATTSNGSLKLTTTHEDTEFLSHQVKNKKRVTVKVRKHYRSAMLQGWNKFCFRGGVLEIRAKLPGRYDVGGLWPGLWMMGNLARATYVASSQNMWPFSYEPCARSTQRKQEVSGCAIRPHFGLNAKQGRGAPEIDLLEVMPGDGVMGMPIPPYIMKKPFYSTSLQLAPAAKVRPFNGGPTAPGAWYEGMTYGPNTSQNVFFYGMELESAVDPEATYWADAVSANTPIGASEFEDFHTYRLEWTPKKRLAWYKDGEFLYEIHQDSLTNLTTSLQIPDEPTYLLLNTAMSSTWGFPAPCPKGCACECFDCKRPRCACAINKGFCDSLPASFLIDHVRLYQHSEHSVGCDPQSHPTSKFIDAHLERYLDPDAPSKRRALDPVPRGGGKCASAKECGLDGECLRKKCRCGASRTGPRCQAPRGFDDHAGESGSPRLEPAGFMMPPQLAVALACVVLAHIVFCRRSLAAIRRERRLVRERAS